MSDPQPSPAAAAARADWVEDALLRLADAGHRSGAARRAVLETLAANDCCLTAQEVFDESRASGRRVGIASVYRVLELLLNLRLVQRVDLGGGVSRYEPDLGGEHHHHLVCVECGEVHPFRDAGLESAIDVAARRLDYAVVDHDVVMRGRCPACA
jgi:Fur family transcriptional regulator, ferric uptake regulator